ncbi:MAG: acyl carrier protein [Gammaproteobacteria bacterium]|nr:acyl carrier protein [Gammaproteobacteria bacterium]
MSNTLIRLTDVFHDVFDDAGLELSRQMSAADVEDWDSLMHVNLVLAAEREFGVRFSSTEVAQLVNVGELVDLIDAKSGNDC